jgi:hypothetical protein
MVIYDIVTVRPSDSARAAQMEDGRMENHGKRKGGVLSRDPPPAVSKGKGVEATRGNLR